MQIVMTPKPKQKIPPPFNSKSCPRCKTGRMVRVEITIGWRAGQAIFKCTSCGRTEGCYTFLLIIFGGGFFKALGKGKFDGRGGCLNCVGKFVVVGFI